MMQAKPVVKQITIYPIKSLDGISVSKAKVGTGGSLEHDREFAIVDGQGKFVNGKSNALVHSLRSAVDVEAGTMAFRHEDETHWQQFHVQNDRQGINEYLSAFFGKPVTLQQNTAGKFLDIPVISGVTVISTASLQTVAGWFNDMPLDETRKRFRATIEIAEVPAFWEDHLFFEEETIVEFAIGDITIYGMSPRARCIVPTRNPHTGEGWRGFQRSFASQRMAMLPEWSLLEDHGHGYYLAVDCMIPASEFGKYITVGDEIIIIGRKTLN